MTTLSFVITARNDDYGGDLLHRMQTSIDSILQLGEQHQLDGEIVLVEWNPPVDEPSLAEALEWPTDLDHMSTRVVTVPTEIHKRFSNAEKIPLFEYIAKNTGIRRADGEFVLSTNPDLIYSSELIEFFADGRLREDCFYRIHRYDVDRLVPLDASIHDRQSFAESHTYKYSTVHDGYVTTDKSTRFREELGRFADIVQKNPTKARFLLTNPGRVYDFASEIYTNIFSTESEDESTESETSDVVVSTPDELEDIFLTSSGDFLLMSSDSWSEMRGYPEMDTNLHVDSFGCVYSVQRGLNQAVLKDPLKIYHQEHDRSERDSRPAMERDELVSEAQKILNGNGFQPYNDDGWGLGSESLTETDVA